VTRWTVAVVAAVILGGIATVALARLLGRSGSRASILVSVVSGWLAACVLWNLAGGLAVHYGWLAWHEGAVFVGLALVGGLWQYRTEVRRGRERGLAVFVGGQLVWLVIVLTRNGVFQP
jgi:hypothetical protein